MTTFSFVMPQQRRVRAEMDAWANGQKTHSVKLVTISPKKATDISRRMAEAMSKSCDGSFDIA